MHVMMMFKIYNITRWGLSNGPNFPLVFVSWGRCQRPCGARSSCKCHRLAMLLADYLISVSVGKHMAGCLCSSVWFERLPRSLFVPGDICTKPQFMLRSDDMREGLARLCSEIKQLENVCGELLSTYLWSWSSWHWQDNFQSWSRGPTLEYKFKAKRGRRIDWRSKKWRD